MTRLAFSVIWTMNSAGKVLGSWIGKTMVNVDRNISFDDAQRVVNGGNLQQSDEASAENELAELEQNIDLLYKISQIQRESREVKGIFTTEKEQININLDESNSPVSIDIREPHPVQQLIGEFEVMANVLVAQKISSNFPEQALLRRQSPPHQRKMDSLFEYAESLGYPIDDENPGMLQASIDSIEDDEIRHGMTAMVLKTLHEVCSLFSEYTFVHTFHSAIPSVC
jgi:exoribonuclease R